MFTDAKWTVVDVTGHSVTMQPNAMVTPAMTIPGHRALHWNSGPTVTAVVVLAKVVNIAQTRASECLATT